MQCALSMPERLSWPREALGSDVAQGGSRMGGHALSTHVECVCAKVNAA